MKYFFIGVAGSGMSAAAQYLKGRGHGVSGSDRIFSSPEGLETKRLLENFGIKCYLQGSAEIASDTDFVVVSTAVEDSVPEYAEAKKRGIKILHRSDLLAEICNANFTVAVAGTSGKSTTAAMIFHILNYCGLKPSLITGAGLISLQKQGLIGNAFTGSSDILVIEADESDGTLVKYFPKIGLVLNVDRDHKEIPELMELFSTFKQHSEKLIVNLDNQRSKSLDCGENFSCLDKNAKNFGSGFSQDISGISFSCGGQKFSLPVIGFHNMQNAMAAISVARLFGISDGRTAEALSCYEGITRRATILYNDNGITVIDDFAHNPAKISAMLSSCMKISGRVLAWFQPHGFKPSKMMKDELVEKLSGLLRKDDVICFSKIYYAGGTADKSVSAEEFSKALVKNGKNSLYFEDRDLLVPYLKKTVQKGGLILLMGARDPSLKDFAQKVVKEISGAETVFLSLGSNFGDRLSYLNQAVKELEKRGVRCVKKSSVFETDSWGYDDKPYLNQVLECETFFTPEKLLEETSKIETLLGRKRTSAGYQARTIDIDILFFNGMTLSQPQLEIPHPKIALRRFVLVPLCEIAPDFLHPVLKKTVSQLLKECEDSGRVEKFLV